MNTTEVDLTGRRTETGSGYLLFLLMSAYLLSFFDRQILILMIEPISRDLHLSDTHFGLLYGFAFALFYTFLGLVFGRFIDIFSRTRVLATAIVLWSAATAACGLANTFGELFVARMLVGIGEAGLAPAAYSLIADLFKPKQRARAFAVYGSGIYLGSGLAFVLGGRLVEFLETLPPLDVALFGTMQGWQLTFMIAGAPGVILGLVIAFTREPQRGRFDQSTKIVQNHAIGTYLNALVSNYKGRWCAYATHHFGFALHTGFGYAILSWMPVFYMRCHNWSIADIGLAMGLMLLICGPLGAFIGGTVTDGFIRRGVRDAHLRYSAIVCVIQACAIAVAILAKDIMISFVGTSAAILALGFTVGPAGAALQTITPAALRGQAGAFYTFIANLLGLSLIPLFVALITEYVYRDPLMVGRSLMSVGFVAMSLAGIVLWSGKHFFKVVER
ncbi:hypothetical protein ACG33_11415 [Steroidobacter denitrificans]|uniref:Major facilitator superfamily (MFS) profile domain-containing protein n=1 Tax=Steroidobacter denitrificans TaxID=465721 RepID=A0A127FBA9_STEDE|nr:MFS transporter [Steroidobacter denitrificans]AMN47697.1 hypothetical protein ACG33_11415 [Steroidobacter denitrificans]